MTNLRDQLQTTLSGTHILERELGGGGMSKVFVAEETRLGRKVVIKVLSPELAQGISVERFEREIKTVAALQQANIVPVISAGDTNGLPYYTMPFVEGESLRARLARGPLAVTEVIGVLRDVSKALAYAHQRGVVHRDIKPDNVLLSGGTAVVTDFGIAKAISAARTGSGAATLTQVGTSIGTPAYMAPEQAAGDPGIDHRADIYSLGAMAYELLSGQPVFAGRTPQRMLAAHMGEAPKPITELRGDLPQALAELVMLCLAKDADARPQAAGEIARVLESITSGSGMQAMPAAMLGSQVSLMRALTLWALTFGVTFVLAKAAIVGIGLPEWVLPSALTLAGLGLPAVLGTWYVQRATRKAVTSTPTLTPGGSPVPQGTLVTMAIQAAPHVSWRRTWRTGLYAGGAFVFVVAAFMLLRAFGIGPAGSLFGKGVLSRNDRVLIARFTATGGDSTLVGALTEALREDLGQSRAVTVMQPSEVREALATMERPAESPLTDALSREIAQRTGAKLVVAGDVAPLGGGYLISVRLLDPATGDPLKSFRETAKDASDLIPAIGRASRTVRGSIGESLRAVHASPRIEQVTTSSFAAFRKYNEAIELSEGVRVDVMRARALLLEAVTIDSTFAMAYRKLSYLETNWQKSVEYASKAFEARDHLGPIERAQAEGLYYGTVVNDLDRAIAAHRDAYRIDSLHPRNLVNLSQLHAQKQDWPGALEWAERAARVDSLEGTEALIAAYVGFGRFDDASRTLANWSRTRSRTGSSAVWYQLNLPLAQGRFDSATAVSRRVLAANPTDLYVRASAMWVELVANEGLGRLRAAEQAWPATLESIRALGFPLTELDRASIYAFMDVWVRERETSSARLDSAVARARFDTIPANLQPYLNLATVYAQAKRPDVAKRWLARYEAEIKDTLQHRRDAWSRHDAEGWIAVAEGRARDAVTEFRAATGLPCLNCNLIAIANLGLAYDVAGEADSARVTYERFLNTHEAMAAFNNPMWRARILRRLGELYEVKGDAPKAAQYYSAFVDLWKGADSDLQPRVLAVREKLKRIAPVERPK